MNPTSQPDLHPDVESLSAFVERALPDQERAQILVHIAACSQCRQIVFLAQDAATRLDVPVTVAAAQRAPRQLTWFRNWRLVWLPITALAAIIGLAIFVQMRRSRHGAEMVRLSPPATPLTEPRTFNPPPKEQGRAGAAVPHEAKKLPAKTPATVQTVPSSEALSADADAPAALPAQAFGNGLNAGEDLAATPTNAYGQLSASSQFESQPVTKSIPPLSNSGAGSSYAATSRATEARMSSPENRDQTRVSSSASTSVFQLQPAPASRGDFEPAVPPSKSSLGTVSRVVANPLPSGRIAVSTVAGPRLILSLDQTGALFRSKDAGRSWEPISQQWVGRAVMVRVQQAFNSMDMIAAEARVRDAEKKSNELTDPAAQVSPAVFEIVNDARQVWVSGDGKNWKAK